MDVIRSKLEEMTHLVSCKPWIYTFKQYDFSFAYKCFEEEAGSSKEKFEEVQPMWGFRLE